MLCAHMRGWLLTKEMAMGIVAVIKRRFLNLDAVDARTHTLRVAARAGKFGVRFIFCHTSQIYVDMLFF